MSAAPEPILRPQYFRDAARTAAPLLERWGRNELMALEDLKRLQEELAVTYSQVKIELKARELALRADRRAAVVAATVAACAEVMARPRRPVPPIDLTYLDNEELPGFPLEAA
jgi:hypothetical protein